MTTSKRKIIVTAGLPYANGLIHIGHLVEYLQTDFWARFQKMRGHECLYICGDDTHGTPIMIKARERKITPEELIAQSYVEHTRDFSDFQIEFDNFGSTHSEENRILCEEFYQHLKNKNYIDIRSIQQLYCDHDKMFLPDRFVKGTCPQCGAKDQYGDNCDVCAATYSPSELKDPYCSLCKNKPTMKPSDHYFFKLNLFKEYLQQWLPTHTSNEVCKKMLEWFSGDLRDWDISRDEPYFGFPIPDTQNKKFFYVWVDAPMGYISSTWQWCKKNNRKLDEFWKDESTEIYHFIGKDITYFHTLFWPALLKSAGYRSPNQIHAHGMLMVNGEKMSKSKGTFISARNYLNHLEPEYLRYYYASKLSDSVDDLDLNLNDFISRVNSDLIGKITNLGSRGAQMLKKRQDGILSEPDIDGGELIRLAQKKSMIIAGYFENRDFSKGIVEIREIADEANKFFDSKAPWKTIDSDPIDTKQILTTTLNLFRIIAIYLKPILPNYVKKIEHLFNEAPYQWSDAQTILINKPINEYEHLATRVDPEKVKAMINESASSSGIPTTTALGLTLGTDTRETKATSSKKDSNLKTKSTNDEPPVSLPISSANFIPEIPALASEIDYEDFLKVDLRVAQVLEAEEIEGADKLLRLKVDLGQGQTRQIIAGIKSAYRAEGLVGRKLLVVANLKPRKMKFGISEGMVIAAGEGLRDLYVFTPDEGARVGQRAK